MAVSSLTDGFLPLARPAASPQSAIPLERTPTFEGFVSLQRGPIPIGGSPVAAGDAREQAREAAEEFVAIALVQPVLASLRESNQAAPPFQPSRGERMFGQMLDARIAQDVVRAADFPLVERLAQDLQRAGGRARFTQARTEPTTGPYDPELTREALTPARLSAGLDLTAR